LVLPFWYRLTRVVPDKGPLNVCVCVCVCVSCSSYINQILFVLQPCSWIKLHTLSYSTNIRSYIHTHTRTHPFNGPFPGLPRWAGTRKVKPLWILLKQETVSGSGISWAVCKSAPCCRQITTPAPHHSVFVQAGCPSCHPTNSVKALKAVSYIHTYS